MACYDNKKPLIDLSQIGGGESDSTVLLIIVIRQSQSLWFTS